MSTAEGTLTPEASNGTGVSNQLASLVPTFDPAVDDLRYTNSLAEDEVDRIGNSSDLGTQRHHIPKAADTSI